MGSVIDLHFCGHDLCLILGPEIYGHKAGIRHGILGCVMGGYLH